MSSSFLLLETGRRSLSAHQRALDTVGHNIANASTGGYSRQEAMMTATEGLQIGGGLTIGTGVRLTEIRRHNDAFLDAQLRDHSGQLTANRHLQDILHQVEMFIGEPSPVGVMASLERFWVGLNDMAQHPDSMAARAMVRESANTLTMVINRIADDLSTLRRDIEETLTAYVAETNAIISDLHQLDEQISAAQLRGMGTSDLEDRRDLLLDRMAELTGSRAMPVEGGRVRVSLSGIPLMEAHHHHDLELQRGADGTLTLWRSQLESPLQVSGAIGGLLQGGVPLIDQVQASIYDLARAIVTGFNEVHQAGQGLDGSTETPFFTMPGGAATMSLSEPVLNGDAGLRAIAAGLTASPGDGENARRLAALKEELEIGGFEGWDDYWRQVVAQLGVRGSELDRAVDVGRLLVKDIGNRRDMVRGVSLDEEVTNLIRFQHAYAAAARLVSAADEMLDIIINRMGR